MATIRKLTQILQDADTALLAITNVRRAFIAKRAGVYSIVVQVDTNNGSSNSAINAAISAAATRCGATGDFAPSTTVIEARKRVNRLARTLVQRKRNVV